MILGSEKSEKNKSDMRLPLEKEASSKVFNIKKLSLAMPITKPTLAMQAERF